MQVQISSTDRRKPQQDGLRPEEGLRIEQTRVRLSSAVASHQPDPRRNRHGKRTAGRGGGQKLDGSGQRDQLAKDNTKRNLNT